MADTGNFPPYAERRRRPRRPRPVGRRFECTYSGCGRVYSRAEHLERHRLNHTPKELFFCPVEGCTLSFVRRDLYLRHKTRHEQQAQTQPYGATPASTTTSAPDIPASDGTASAVSSQLNTLGVFAAGDAASKRQAHHASSSTLGPAPSSPGYLPDASAWSYSQSEPMALPTGGRAAIPLALPSSSALPNTVLECEAMGPSPSSTEEFTAWLFGGQTDPQGQPTFSDLGLSAACYLDGLQDLHMDHSYAAANPVNPHRTLNPAGDALEEADPRSKGLTAERWLQLRNLITEKLMDTGFDSDDEPFEDPDMDQDHDPLSVSSMQTYLDSYWEYFQEYLPILHQATFSLETAHSYLAVALLILGSSMLTRQAGYSGSTLKSGDAIAWNLRGRVLTHVDAGPPSRLWVLQTLLLLEVHDKLLSTRELHERALVYFPTTLNLMRRSSTLFGRQVSKSRRRRRPAEDGPDGSRPDTEMSVGFFAPRRPTTPPPEVWWEQWIVQEAIRRAAFAAFVLDVTHSVMFGHAPTLVFHEIHLYLPCDRLLWASGAAAEVGALESSLYANGVKPLSFLDGLRRMVSCEPCRTNPFGALILLAGLLSIIGHMQQRDLLVSTLKSSLDAGSAPEKWQPRLSKALTWWKKEYDGHLRHLRGAVLDWQKYALTEGSRSGWGSDVASGLIFYHLGHISIYITMPELSVRTGASTILGRPVSPFEKRMIADKVKHWASSPGSVDSVYHALELIKFILFPTPVARNQDQGPRESRGLRHTAEGGDASSPYQARYDKLPNRSWALYFATMVVWAYGFHRDGPLKPFPNELGYPPTRTPAPSPVARNAGRTLLGTTSTDASPGPPVTPGVQIRPRHKALPDTLQFARYEDVQTYLGVMAPSSATTQQNFGRHLQDLTCGRNRCIGLLAVVDEVLSGANWELLNEARQRLRSAAVMLKGEGSPE